MAGIGYLARYMRHVAALHVAQHLVAYGDAWQAQVSHKVEYTAPSHLIGEECIPGCVGRSGLREGWLQHRVAFLC
jgi:hypothetical protein